MYLADHDLESIIIVVTSVGTSCAIYIIPIYLMSLFKTCNVIVSVMILLTVLTCAGERSVAQHA